MYLLTCVAVENLGHWAGPVPVGAGEMTHFSLWQHARIPFCVGHWQEKPHTVPWMDTQLFQISNRIEELPPSSLLHAKCLALLHAGGGGGLPSGRAILPAQQGRRLLLWELGLGRLMGCRLARFCL